MGWNVTLVGLSSVNSPVTGSPVVSLMLIVLRFTVEKLIGTLNVNVIGRLIFQIAPSDTEMLVIWKPPCPARPDDPPPPPLQAARSAIATRHAPLLRGERSSERDRIFMDC